MTNVARVRDMLLRQWNDRDITAVDDYIAENHVDHRPMPGQQQGRTGVRALIESALERREIRVEIHECFGDGDMVASRYTIHSTHRVDFHGAAAEGRSTANHIVAMDRLENGQIVESWGEYDSLGLLRQLDALPEGFTTLLH
jgi:predicted ester cyclase